VGKAVLIALGVFFGLVLIGASMDRPSKGGGASATAFNAPSEDPVRVTHVTWRKDGFGSVMIANFTFKNDNEFAVKDVEVTCIHSANSGTEMDRNTRTIYERIPANSSAYFDEVNMGFIDPQARSTRCEVTDYARA
jgi:hypothetical protein